MQIPVVVSNHLSVNLVESITSIEVICMLQRFRRWKFSFRCCYNLNQQKSIVNFFWYFFCICFIFVFVVKPLFSSCLSRILAFFFNQSTTQFPNLQSISFATLPQMAPVCTFLYFPYNWRCFELSECHVTIKACGALFATGNGQYYGHFEDKTLR